MASLGFPLGGRLGFASSSATVVAGGLQIGLVVLGAQAESADAWHFIVPLLIPLSLWGWHAAFRRFRLIDDVPLSRIGSAAQGYVELQGIGQKRADGALISRVTMLPCLWYRYRIEERRDSDNEWTTIESGVSELTFEIRDASGLCVIDPEGAEVVAARKDVTCTDSFRYTEEMILAGETIYVLGDFNTVNSADGVFFIANRPPEDLVRRYRWISWAHLTVFFVAVGGTAILYL